MKTLLTLHLGDQLSALCDIHMKLQSISRFTSNHRLLGITACHKRFAYIEGNRKANQGLGACVYIYTHIQNDHYGFNTVVPDTQETIFTDCIV